MVPHRYIDASDNLAQFHADQIDRQEVTVEWYLDHMIDECVFRWTSDEDAEIGLDPWRFYMDLPLEPEEIVERRWRLFVQRKDMPQELRTKSLPAVRSERVLIAKEMAGLSTRDAELARAERILTGAEEDNRTEDELMDAAEQRYRSQ